MMTQADTHQRFIIENTNIRGEIVRLNHSFQTIMQQHHYPAAIFNLLAECLVSSVLLSSTLKFDGQLTLQFQSGGAVKMLVAKCNRLLHIRGLAQFDNLSIFPHTPDILLDEGQLVVTIHQGDTINYQSIIPLERKPIAKNIEDYFGQSVQIPTKICLTATSESATGILLQLLPQTDPTIKERESFWQQADKIETITHRDMVALDNATILQLFYPDEDIRLFDEEPIQFVCQCSPTKMENVIRMLGKNETDEIFAEKQMIDITCEYCNKIYTYDRAEVDRILSSQN